MHPPGPRPLPAHEDGHALRDEGGQRSADEVPPEGRCRMIVLLATTTTGGKAAMKMHLPPTPEDVRRLRALIDESPGLVGAEWTGREGEDVR